MRQFNATFTTFTPEILEFVLLMTCMYTASKNYMQIRLKAAFCTGLKQGI